MLRADIPSAAVLYVHTHVWEPPPESRPGIYLMLILAAVCSRKLQEADKVCEAINVLMHARTMTNTRDK